ncbi:hypothetical protein OMAG_000511, partial [Candidatus Omnitrophus magneticus]
IYDRTGAYTTSYEATKFTFLFLIPVSEKEKIYFIFFFFFQRPGESTHT